jgi:hypothetical protein
MFLIDRPGAMAGLRADLAPRQLFGGTGDLVRAALAAHAPVTGPVAPLSRRPVPPLELTTTAPARLRKAG